MTVMRKRRKSVAKQSVKIRKRPKIDSDIQECDRENLIAESGILYGREKEVELLEKYLHEGVVNKSATSVFISGPPGTGKTLVIRTVLQKMMSKHSITKPIYINCVSTNSEKDILLAMHESLTVLKERFGGVRLLSEVQKQFANTKDHIIIVLDEIDYVRPKDRGFLCTVFSWPKIHQNVSVVGIGNMLDMTELPKHKLKCIPKLVIFSPYTETQLQHILSRKLKNNSNLEAIELCARKVAAMTGDARKALQVAQRSLSVDSSVAGTPCRNVLGILSTVYSPALLQTRIPLQQKIILATMLRLAENKSCVNIDKGCLLFAYKEVCERLAVPALEVDEIYSALSLLESQSLLISKSTSYQLLVDPVEAKKVIADTTLVSQISTVTLSNN